MSKKPSAAAALSDLDLGPATPLQPPAPTPEQEPQATALDKRSLARARVKEANVRINFFLSKDVADRLKRHIYGLKAEGIPTEGMSKFVEVSVDKALKKLGK